MSSLLSFKQVKYVHEITLFSCYIKKIDAEYVAIFKGDGDIKIECPAQLAEEEAKLGELPPGWRFIKPGPLMTPVFWFKPTEIYLQAVETYFQAVKELLS